MLWEIAPKLSRARPKGLYLRDPPIYLLMKGGEARAWMGENIFALCKSFPQRPFVEFRW